LMALAKTQKELTQESPTSSGRTVNNNLFVGSTSDLLKMIKNNGNDTQ